VFSFQDEDESWLSLRYDLTAPLARYVAANFDSLPKPYRSYRAGWVFRNEKPGPGRFRQFMQFDADTVGASSPAADAEICMMAADVMEELFGRGNYVIKVNNRKVLDGVMEAAGITDDQKLTVLRAIDKVDRLGTRAVEQLLGEGRKDESGDFTKGAGLDWQQITRVMSLVGDPTAPKSSAKGVAHKVTVANLEYRVGDSEKGKQGAQELEAIGNLVESSGYQDRIDIDPSVVRGLEYYTGPVFEAQLTFEVPNEKGEPVVFGSVGGGGRYDGLVGRFRGEDVPATGFSVGVSRLASALKAVGKLGDEDAHGPVVVTVMDKDRLADYQRIVADLRGAGVAAEMYLGSSGMKAQLKYADRRNSPVAIIAGSNEFESGRLQVKDLAAGKAQATAIADHPTWKEERPGQFEVARDQVVGEVKALLQKQARAR
jgi:histidyl-tRNA synthetase